MNGTKMMPKAVRAHRVVRTRALSHAWWFSTVVGLLLWGGGVVSVASDHRGGSDLWIYIAGVFVVLGVLHVTASVRGATGGVRVDEHGIRIRNPLQTFRLEWGDIEGFHLGETRWNPCVGVVELKSGDRLTIAGIQGVKTSFRVATADAEAAVEELRRELDAARARRSAP